MASSGLELTTVGFGNSAGGVCRSLAPGLLVLGGWDNNRWVFFVLTNLFLWLWRLAGVAKIERLRAPTVLVLIIAALVIARIPIYYFDHKSPRDFGYPEAKRFAHELVHGPMFKKPSE